MAGNLNQLMAVHIETGVVANYDYVVTRGFEIIQVLVQGNVTTPNADVQPQTSVSGGAYTDLGVLCDADTINDIEYSNTVVEAQKTLTAGDTIRMAAEVAGVANQADAFVWLVPTSWIAG